MASKKELLYEFARTEGGEEIGFNDSVTTTFKGHPAYSLARESIQNIIDAVDDKDRPVVAEFTLKTIKGVDVPNYDQLADILKSCKEYYKENQSSVDFFSKAYNILKKNKDLGLLTISDYNTKGMPGDDDDKSGNYYNFLKSSGASSKSGGTGGSFGLGKGAYYAASAFHAIFVSSIYGANECVFQGKLRLVSHEKNGTKYQSTGSFGYSKQVPVRDITDIPHLFKRSEKGTDISILGFYDTENWETIIVNSVLTNFWLAILKRKLIVRVGEIEISSETIERLMLAHFDEFEKEVGDYQNPRQSYLAYTSPNSIEYTDDLPVLGRVTIRILLKDNYNKRVAFFRQTGMQIKKVRYPLPNPFAAVFECDNETGNTILRAMENPQHTEWDPENAREKTDEVYESSKKADKELREFVRASLKKVFGGKSDKELNIPGLSKYLFVQTKEESQSIDGPGNETALERSDDAAEKETAREVGIEHNERATIEIAHQVKVLKKKTKVSYGGDKNIEVGGGGHGKGGEQKKGDEDPDGRDGRLITDVLLRSFAQVSTSGEVEHVIMIHGRTNIAVTLVLAVGTDDSLGSVSIRNALDSKGVSVPVADNKVAGVLTDEHGNQRITLKFQENERYALNILAYENK